MSLTDTTPPGQTDAVAFEVDLPHAPEKIWRALTEPALLARWLLPAVGFDPAPGRAFRFQTDPHPGWDGTVASRIVDCEAPRRLSYTWDVGEALRTVVTFTLEATPSGTRLSLLQTGFAPEQKQNFGGARYGWKLMLGKLDDLMAQDPK
jgi:uncharacterized protein YndB with AHSA1/START domain